MKGKRSGLEFEKHELTVTHTDEPNILITVHRLKKPDTFTESMKFINTNGVLVVTGDWGNWIFCREFHPGPKNGVSDGYWCEKLQIASSQEPYEYDEDATRVGLNERLCDAEEPPDEKTKEYLLECLDRCGEEFYYLAWAHDNMPHGYDHEYVVNRRKIKPWLQVVFDGFDEICRRMKEQSTIKEEPHS